LTNTEMNESISELLKTLPEDHLLNQLYQEHRQIKGYLDELERISRALPRYKTYDEAQELFDHLKKLCKNLLAAEPHHQREENILFPEMEKRGVTGPPSVMRTEHEGLREFKQKLADLVNHPVPDNFSDYKARVMYLATGIVGFLRQHIYKEDFVLYPMANRIIKDTDLWQEMKRRSDEIGACRFGSFTPLPAVS